MFEDLPSALRIWTTVETSGNNLSGNSPPLLSFQRQLRSTSRPPSASRSLTPHDMSSSTTITMINSTITSNTAHHSLRRTSPVPHPIPTPLSEQQQSSESNYAASRLDPVAAQRGAMLSKYAIPDQASPIDDRPPLPATTAMTTSTSVSSVSSAQHSALMSVLKYIL
jgi:hypothetical protein